MTISRLISDEKCIFEDKEYKLGESRRHKCNLCRCVKGGHWACLRALKGCPTPGKIDLLNCFTNSSSTSGFVAY